MLFKFFLAVEALEGVDLEDFIVFDLAGALELGGSFCAVGFFMGLVSCSMLEGPVSCGQRQKPRRKFLKPLGQTYLPWVHHHHASTFAPVSSDSFVGWHWSVPHG